MPWPPIVKPPHVDGVPPNMRDYAAVCAAFSWDKALAELERLPGTLGLNMAHEAVDRHARGARGSHVALRWLGKNGQAQDFTYNRLREQTNRFANVLASLGVAKGDRVCVLAGRVPELYIAALGTLKNRSIFCPLFSAFGPEPIRARLRGTVPNTTEPWEAERIAKHVEGVKSVVNHLDVLSSDVSVPTEGTK